MYRNPHQEASQEKKNRAERFSSGVQTALNLAIGGSAIGFGGSKIAEKALPLLSKFIPEDLMLKGLSKIDPRIGKFADTALKAGNSIEEVRDYIGGKLSPPEHPQDNRNIIEQYSPELKQFIEEQIQQGRSPLEAGALAQNTGKFTQIIKKLTQDHKSPWSAILESIYGGAGQAQPQQEPQQIQQGQNPSGVDPQLSQIIQGLTNEIKKIRGR